MTNLASKVPSWYITPKYAYSVNMFWWLIEECCVPSEKYKLNKFKHVLTDKMWGDPYTGKWWGPTQVLKDPTKYKEDYDRIKNADLRYPILMTEKFEVIDGNHRITKSFMERKKSIRVRIIPRKILKELIVHKTTKNVFDKLDAMDMKDVRKLYLKKKKKILKVCREIMKMF